MNSLEERWQKFVEWSHVHMMVVACRKCGSSYLDAGLPPTQLHCCVCRTTTHFDDERFIGLRLSQPFEGMTEDQTLTLLRKLGHDFGYPHEAEKTLKAKDAKEGDLQHDLLQALNSFLSQFSTISSNLDVDPQAKLKLRQEWEATKARLDIIIAAMHQEG